MGPMARWPVPRSHGGRLAVQVALLTMVVGLVYLLVMWLGSGLMDSTGQEVNAAL